MRRACADATVQARNAFRRYTDVTKTVALLRMDVRMWLEERGRRERLRVVRAREAEVMPRAASDSPSGYYFIYNVSSDGNTATGNLYKGSQPAGTFTVTINRGVFYVPCDGEMIKFRT